MLHLCVHLILIVIWFNQDFKDPIFIEHFFNASNRTTTKKLGNWTALRSDGDCIEVKIEGNSLCFEKGNENMFVVITLILRSINIVDV